MTLVKNVETVMPTELLTAVAVLGMALLMGLSHLGAAHRSDGLTVPAGRR